MSERNEADLVHAGPSDEPAGTPSGLSETELLSGFEDLLDAPSGADVSDDNESADGQPAQGASGSSRRRSRLVRTVALTVGAVVLLSVGVAVGYLVAGDDTSDADSATGSAFKPTLDLAAAGVFDSFARESESLGVADSGQEWQVVSGSWRIDRASVRVLEPSESGPSIALINMRASDGLVQVTMPNPERAAGLVFRYESPFNHWSLTAAPNSATWVVTKVEEGVSETVALLGTAPVGPNVTIAVQFVGDQLTFLVDGFERETLEDDFLSDTRRVGMIARGTDIIDAEWTNFVAVAQADQQ